MTITLEDVATKAGVSTATVSYILTNSGASSRITNETRQKVFRIARELRYRPNQIARGLKLNKTMTIGVIFTNAIGTFMNRIIDGIDRVAHEHGYNLFLCTSDDDWRKEARHVRMLRDRRVDGMIMFFVSCRIGEKASHDHLLEIKRDGIPLVFIDRYLPDTEIDYVVGDDYGGSYQAVTHLINLGHQRIAHIRTPDDCTSIRERTRGYRQALIDAGLPARDEYVRVALDKESCHKVVRELLEIRERPTAILTVTDGEAVVALRVTREAGLRVPTDIAVVGFGNDESSAHLEIPLTCVDQPKSEMGQKAAEILIQKIEHPEVEEVARIAIKVRLIIRDSCGTRKFSQTAGATSRPLGTGSLYPNSG